GRRGQEACHLVGVGDQLAVEVAGVPVEQHAAHVEDRNRGPWEGRFRGCSRGQFGAFFQHVSALNLVSQIKELKASSGRVFCWSLDADLLGCKPVPPGPLAGPYKRAKTRSP